jgi:predicted RND superfamily exporter protein
LFGPVLSKAEGVRGEIHPALLFKNVVAQFIGLVKITNDKAQMSNQAQNLKQ